MANSAKQLMSFSRQSVQSPPTSPCPPQSPVTSRGLGQPPPLPANPPRSLPGRKKSVVEESDGDGSASPCSPTDDQDMLVRKHKRNGAHPPATPQRTSSKLSYVAPPMLHEAPELLHTAPELDGDEDTSSPVHGHHQATDVLSFRVRGTALRPVTGALLGIGHRDVLSSSAEVTGPDDTVYRRNPNGVYFQIAEQWPAVNDSNEETQLIAGDEVLAIDRYKMVDMSIETARMLLVDRALLGETNIVIARETTSMTDSSLMNGNTVCNGHAEPVASLSTFDESGATECLTIELFREFSGKGLGLGVVGGSDAGHGPTSVFIKNIFPNSIAADDGRLAIGDELLSVNGEQLSGMTNHEVTSLIQQLPNGLIRLVIQRPVQQSNDRSVPEQDNTTTCASYAPTPEPPPRTKRRKSNIKSSLDVENPPTEQTTTTTADTDNIENNNYIFNKPMHQHIDGRSQQDVSESGQNIAAEQSDTTSYHVNGNGDDADSCEQESMAVNYSESDSKPTVTGPEFSQADEQESRIRLSSDEDSDSPRIATNPDTDAALTTTSMAISQTSNNDDDEMPPMLPDSAPPTVPPPIRPESLPLAEKSQCQMASSPMPVLSPPSPYASKPAADMTLAAVMNQLDASLDPLTSTHQPNDIALISSSIGDTTGDEDAEEPMSLLSEEDRKLIESVLRSDHAKTLNELNECVALQESIIKRDAAGNKIQSSEHSSEDHQAALPCDDVIVMPGIPASEEANRSDSVDADHNKISRIVVGSKQQEAATTVDSEKRSQSMANSESRDQSDFHIIHVKNRQKQRNAFGNNALIKEFPQSDKKLYSSCEGSESKCKEFNKEVSSGHAVSLVQSDCQVVPETQQKHEVPHGMREQPTNANEFSNYVSLIQSSGFQHKTRKPGLVTLPPQVSVEFDEKEPQRSVHEVDDSENVTTISVRMLESSEHVPFAQEEQQPLMHDMTADEKISLVESESTSSALASTLITKEDSIGEVPEPCPAQEAVREVREDHHSTEGDDVFSVCSGTSSQDPAAGGDALSKSRRMLSSDQSVSDVMRAYYEDTEPTAQEEEDAKKSKPKKPLIAQALLPKSARVAHGNVASPMGLPTGIVPTLPASPASLSSDDWQQQKRELAGIHVTGHNRTNIMCDSSQDQEGFVDEVVNKESVVTSPTVGLKQPKFEHCTLPANDQATSDNDASEIVVPSVAAARALFESQRSTNIFGSLSHSKTFRPRHNLSDGSSVSTENNERHEQLLSSPLTEPSLKTVRSSISSEAEEPKVDDSFKVPTPTSMTETDSTSTHTVGSQSVSTLEEEPKPKVPSTKDDESPETVLKVSAARALFEANKMKSAATVAHASLKQAHHVHIARQGSRDDDKKTVNTGLPATAKSTSVSSRTYDTSKVADAKSLFEVKKPDASLELVLTPKTPDTRLAGQPSGDQECSDSVDSVSNSSTVGDVPSSASSDSGVELSTKSHFSPKFDNLREKMVARNSPATKHKATPDTEASDIATEMPKMADTRAFFQSMEKKTKVPASGAKCARSASMSALKVPPPVATKTKPAPASVSSAIVSPGPVTDPAGQVRASSSWTNFGIQSPSANFRPRHALGPNVGHTTPHASVSPDVDQKSSVAVSEDGNLSVAASKALFETRKSTDAKKPVDGPPDRVASKPTHGQAGSKAEVTVGRSASMATAHRPTVSDAGATSVSKRPGTIQPDPGTSLKAWRSFMTNYAGANK